MVVFNSKKCQTDLYLKKFNKALESTKRTLLSPDQKELNRIYIKA